MSGVVGSGRGAADFEAQRLAGHAFERRAVAARRPQLQLRIARRAQLQQIVVAARTAPYAQVENFAGTASNRSYTLEMWFNLVEGSPNSGNLLVRTNRDNPGADGDFRLYLDNGKLMLAYNVIGSAVPGGVQTRAVLSLDENLAFAPGDGWTHVAVTVSQSACIRSANMQSSGLSSGVRQSLALGGRPSSAMHSGESAYSTAVHPFK